MNILSRLFWKSIPKPERKLLLAMLNEPNRQVADKILNQKHSFPNYFDRHQCIFIHTPKVAGISVIHALGFEDSHTWHLPLKYYEVTEPDKYAAYFKFGFVRNPWDRLFSAYNFLKNGGISSRDEGMTRVVERYDHFNDFVMKWLSDEAAHSFIHFTPMHRFFENLHGEISADFIGRFENLQNDYDEIREHLEVGKALPHKNASVRANYRAQYSSQAIDKVAAIYERDIHEFNYDFN